VSLTDDLYRDVILEHFRQPHNWGRLDPADIAAQGVNPFCGDDLEITGRLQGDTLVTLMSQGKGCSISQASASLMTDALKGRPLEEAIQLPKAFKDSLLLSTDAPRTLPDALSELHVLEGVKKYPVRIKCALLGWNTFLEGVEQRQKAAAQADAAPSPSEPGDTTTWQGAAQAALKTVIDPELNINIVDLGLVYQTEVNGEGQVRVTYTLTSPGCPLGPVIQSQLQAALKKLLWVTQVHCNLVWTPPWDPKTMASEEAKMELGLW